jgi:glycosyltransferase involved in cell wall biosynthesis
MPALLKHRQDLVYFAVGDGPDRPRLEAKARALKLDGQVIFPGRIPEGEKVAHYNLADVYVMPSSGEGFGIVLIEAAACGVPLVGSAADGSRDALLDGRLGQLIDPHNPQELVAAVLRALEQPHERLQAVETFSVPSFRARVSAWSGNLRDQISADSAARSVRENRHVAAR